MFTKSLFRKQHTTNESTRQRAPARHHHVKIVLAAIGVLVLAVAGLTFGLSAAHGHAAQVTCGTAPSSCGYPDATNTGVPTGTTLKTVPGQVSSGPGWSYNSGGWVAVTGNGANLTGLNIPYGVVISADNVTLNDDQITTGGPNTFGVSLRHTAGATIQNTTITGSNGGANEVTSGIKDISGDSTGLVVNHDNISNFESGLGVEAGLIENSYIHNPGYVAGDHTNGIISSGGGGGLQLTINHNTIFNGLTQTDDIGLFEDIGAQANRTITNNLLAGGAYSIYGGATKTATYGPTSNIVITGNVFAANYHSTGGNNGPVAYFNSAGTGNNWANNTWDTLGTNIPAP